MSEFAPQESSGDKKIVLILDDDRKLVDLLSKCFCSIGMKVLTAANADEATNILNHTAPDLMVIDCETPTESEDPFLNFLDSQAPRWHIPSIVLCKSSDLSSVNRVQNIFAYYVHKSPQAWSKIEMFANELVTLSPYQYDNETSDDNSSKSDNFQ
ncbi:MAG: response regulator [Mariniblastus sp.]